MLRAVIGGMSFGVGRFGVHVRGGGALRIAAPRCHIHHQRQQHFLAATERCCRARGVRSLLPTTVVQLEGGLTGRGGVLKHVRAYGRGDDDWDDDYFDDDDDDDDGDWGADADENAKVQKAEKDLLTLRGLQGPRLADSLPMPEPGEVTDPPRKVTKDDVTVTFARSGGAGGQNVNKVNTKVDMRLNLEKAVDWLHPWVARRLVILEKNRVNKDGELVMQSSRYRTQSQNLDDALEKIQARLVSLPFSPISRHVVSTLIRRQRGKMNTGDTRHTPSFSLRQSASAMNVSDKRRLRRADPRLQACINRASKLPQQKSNKAKVKKLANQANKANAVRLENKKRGSQKKKLRSNKNIEYD